MTNYAILIGNIATDLELKQAGNNSVLRFNLAVKNPFKKDDTNFIPVEAWNKQAQVIVDYCRKGSKLAVEGSIKIDQWQDDAGNKKSFTKVIVNRIELIEPKNSQNQQNNGVQQANHTQTNNNNQNNQNVNRGQNNANNGYSQQHENPFANSTVGEVYADDSTLPF